MSINKKVVFLPYDFDTAIGINNEGALVFSYNLEDTDHTDGGADVYNGQQSVLWKNLRDAFGPEIKAMYQNLRSTGALSYLKVEGMFEGHQGKWPEAIFNEDAWFKYLAPLVEKGNASYLSMLQGSKAEQRKWWLYNRFRYIDSKYNAGDALTDVITVRGYAKANVTVTPYADIYASIKYGSYLVQTRAARGNDYTLVCPLDNVNDTEIYIYSASQLASVGDLSGLMVGYADFSQAIKLQDLKLGDDDVTYSNGNLTELYLGNNALLRTLDVRNCPNLAQAVDISGCSNIEDVYFDGTAITSLALPKGGVLKTLHVPETMTNLTIINQPGITEFEMPDYSSLTSLRLEHVGAAVDSKAILNDLASSSRVRLIGIHWEVEDADEIRDLFDKLDEMRGLDEYGNNVEAAQVSGTIHTEELTGADLVEFRSWYPNITVTADHTTSVLTYMTYDGSSVITTETIQDGGDGTVENTTTREADVQYIYSANGWSRVANGAPDASATVGVVEDRTVYAAYDTVVQTYRVRFYNGTTLLQTLDNVPYGSTAVYTGATPTYSGTDAENYEFVGWRPTCEGITGNTDCSARFRYTGILTYKVLDRSIAGEFDNDTITKVGASAFSGCTSLTTVSLPAVTNVGDSAFYSCTSLTTVSLPAATSVGDRAFDTCRSLTTVSFPVLSTVGASAFSACSNLTVVNLPAATTVGASAFNGCTKLESVNLPVATTVGASAFQSCTSLVEITLPAATSIEGGAFSGCSKLESVNLLALTSLVGFIFSGCSKLAMVNLPAVTIINSEALSRRTALTTVILGNTEQVATLSSTSAFLNSDNAIIYVPDALVNDYKSATNWSSYASRIKGISELPE